MRRHPFYQTVWIAINSLVAVSLLLLALGIAWEYSARSYLKGFADAVVPLTASPEQKVEAILAWMKHGPARRTTTDAESLDLRDPEVTLNYQKLLQVCGSATNAFVNLAVSTDLPARRLLLLGPDRRATHVVAEVRWEGRWQVVDPAFHFVLRDAAGHPLIREQLRDPRTFRQATQDVAGYRPEYNFERTTHVRLERLPFIGGPLRKALDQVLPAWEEAPNWTLMLERESMAAAFGAGLLVVLSLVARFLWDWYGERRLGFIRVHVSQQLLRAGLALFSIPR